MQKNNKKIRSFFIIFILIFIIGAGGLFLYQIQSRGKEINQSSKSKMPMTVEAESAIISKISHNLELTGSVEPYRIARLASPAEGPVVGIQVREGDRVKSADALLSIGRKKGVDALMNSLREELKKEENNLSRTRQLLESGIVSVEQLDQAKSAYEKVRAQLVKAEEAAQDYVVFAPWDGIVSRLLVKEGEFVAPRTALLEMYAPSSLVIQSAVPERYSAEITIGMPVEVRLDAYPETLMEGKISRIYPYLDQRLRTRTMEITLKKPVTLLPGMFARLKVLLKNANDAVVIPTEAIVATPKGKAVLVMKDGKAVRRSVKTGIEEGTRIQILSGIQPGDMVIVAGNEKLKDGAPVRLSAAEKAGGNKNRNMTGLTTEQNLKTESGR